MVGFLRRWVRRRAAAYHRRVKPTRQRAREALRSHDFRRLFAIRLVSQSADGLFQAALVASVVFNPEEQSTALGFAIATLDRLAPVLDPRAVHGRVHRPLVPPRDHGGGAVAAGLARVARALRRPGGAVAFYGGALFVLSVNRFYLATAVAVVPRLVPTEDLLMANSMSIVGGTVALLAGVFVGGWMADLLQGEEPRGRARRDPMGGGLVHRVEDPEPARPAPPSPDRGPRRGPPRPP